MLRDLKLLCEGIKIKYLIYNIYFENFKYFLINFNVHQNHGLTYSNTKIINYITGNEQNNDVSTHLIIWNGVRGKKTTY